MPIGSSITEPIPAVGTAGTEYAEKIVAFLQEVKARLEAKVALTSLLAGTFDLANNPIDNAEYLGLYEQVSAPSSPVGSLQNYGGDLYYVSASGAARITNGNSLDVVSAGGITGDYAGPAEFRYDLGSTTYQALSDTGTTPDTWAYVAARAFDIYGGATSANKVRLITGGAAAYTLTLPAALPGGQVALQLGATGSLVASNSFASDVSVTGAISATTTVTGTDHRFTSPQTLVIPGAAAIDVAGTSHARATGGTAGVVIGWELGNNVDPLCYPITGLRVGDVIGGFTLYMHKDSNATSTITAALYRYRDLLDSETSLGSGTNALNAPGPTTIAVTSLSEVVGAGYQYVVKVTSTGNVSSERMESLTVAITRP